MHGDTQDFVEAGDALTNTVESIAEDGGAVFPDFLYQGLFVSAIMNHGFDFIIDDDQFKNTDTVAETRVIAFWTAIMVV